MIFDSLQSIKTQSEKTNDPHEIFDLEPTDDERRRGATSVEYLFVVSLIIVLCITVIQHFGSTTKKSMTRSSDIIQKATAE